MVLAIYGAGGSGKELLDMLAYVDCGSWTDILFLDDYSNCNVQGHKRMSFGDFQKRFSPGKAEVVIAVGEPGARAELRNRVKGAGYKLATIIHPSAFISPSAVVKAGCVIRPDVVVSCDVVLEENVWLQRRAVLGHDVTVGADTQISYGVVVGGGAKIGSRVYLGINACVREQIEIGNDVIGSMGTVILKSVNPEMIVMGNPARVIAKNSGHSVFRNGANKENSKP